jgi:GT2 family glycosyltransferase
MNISIVIPVYNKWNFTKSCLEDLSKLPKETHEIIVVDNGSSDETSEAIKKYDITYHRNEINLGFSKACNIGYGLASGDIVMFLNNDIRVQSNYNDWTDVIVKAIKLNLNSLVGPTMGQLDNKLNFVKEANIKLDGNSYMSGWCLAAHKNTWNKLIIRRSDRLFSTDAYHPVNNVTQVFSEEYGLAYFEDTDLSFRARMLNIPFQVVNIPVVHFGKISSKQLNTYELYTRARKIFVAKWGSKL